MKLFYTFLIAFGLILTLPAQAFFVIRDTEVENVLLKLVKDNFKAAGLNPANAAVYIVNDNSINAFVAGGQTIFIHSGLITHATSIDDIAFVLSHETGHIVGGHIVRGINQMKNTQTTALISTVLGGLLAVAGGRPDAGLAIMMGGTGSAMNSYLAYRQTEESAADRIAVDIMQKTGYSMAGFTNTMKQLQAEERLNANPDIYLSTHPMTRERMRDIERFTQNAAPLKHDIRFELIKAKLTAFLMPPEHTRHLYQGTALADKYARAIAAYRDNQLADSLKQIDKLIQQEPKKPFFYELKGQF
ncbi:MAG: M48 family metallopeptidase, partial [Alphaproteobacteria bacterium]